MRKKEITTTKFVAAFSITLVIFMSGVWLGNFINSARFSDIELLQKDYLMNMQGISLKYELLKENLCDNFNKSLLTLELYKIGKKLTYLESKLGPNDKYVKSLKENYHLLAIKNWLFMNEVSKKCNKTINSMLYFYAEKNSCPECEDQGNILTYVHKKYPYFNIYSFDSHIDNPAIKTLLRMYDIKILPSVVYNGKVYSGFQSKSQLLKILNKTIAEYENKEQKK